MKEKKLSDTALAIAQAYAIYHPERPARSKAMQWINKVRREVGLQSIKQQDVMPAIEELASAGIIDPPISGERGVAARGPGAKLGTITHFCRLAVETGVANGLLQQLDENTYDARRYGYYDRLPHFIEQHLRLSLMTGEYDQYSDASIPDSALLWLIEPTASSYLQSLSNFHRQQACEAGLRFLITTSIFQLTNESEKGQNHSGCVLALPEDQAEQIQSFFL